jgi:hypothetical protein
VLRCWPGQHLINDLDPLAQPISTNEAMNLPVLLPFIVPDSSYQTSRHQLGHHFSAIE